MYLFYSLSVVESQVSQEDEAQILNLKNVSIFVYCTVIYSIARI